MVQECAAEVIRDKGVGSVMKRIQFALVAVMLCATVSACKREEAPAPAPVAAEPAPVEQAAPPEPAPVESVPTPAPAPAPADAAESDDKPQSGGDKVGG